MTQTQKHYAGKLIREIARKSGLLTNEQLWDLVVRIVKGVLKNTDNKLEDLD
mgnify:CR=1 FL=1|jgi:hypothetical protein